MVATRLNEITAKGLDWYNSHSESANTNSPSTSSSRSTPADSATESSGPSSSAASTWDYASNSLNYAAEQAYSTFAGTVSSFYTECAEAAPPAPLPSSLPSSSPSIAVNQATVPEMPQPSAATTDKTTLMAIRKYPQLMSWMLKNPYSSVRGRHHQPSSMSAVRSLLTLVPFEKNQAIYSDQRMDPEGCLLPQTVALDDEVLQQKQPLPPSFILDDTIETTRINEPPIPIDASSCIPEPQPTCTTTIMPPPSMEHNNNNASMAIMTTTKSVSSAETASQLAEGAVRALRDIALDEGMELHGALRHWTDRWENPFLSWLEAGPWGTYYTFGLFYVFIQTYTRTCKPMVVTDASRSETLNSILF